ncbi:hypothetical protein D3C80_1692050 [compost metagenome]
MGGAVLHTDAFAFQRRNVSELTGMGDENSGVVVVRVGESDLLETFRRDVHTGNHRVKTTEFQAWDQAVKRLVGEGTGGLHLFTHGVRQIDVEALDLVAGVDKLKRRIRRFHRETDGISRAG